MKSRLLFSICTLFALCITVASAQSYSVRVTFNTNLRASYSLQATISDVANAGATLNVTGSHESWLRIHRNNRDLWLADWVPMTRLDSPQTVPSDIDNCCFIDRQCTTDDDWVNGYWAYQNNQCGAPATTIATDSTQPTGTTSATVNNCCYIDRHCSNDSQWEAGFWAYQNNQCGAPSGSGHNVFVEGSEGFRYKVQRALDELKKWSPIWYDYVNNKLFHVRQETHRSYSGILIDSRTFVSNNKEQTVDDVTTRGIYVMVGDLAHEACHLHQWDDGTATGGWRNEIGCLHAQLAASEAVDPLDRQSPWLRNLIANIEDPAYWWWTD